MMRRWVLCLALLTVAATSFCWALGRGALPPRRPHPARRSLDRPRWDINRQLELQKVLRPSPAGHDRLGPISGAILDSATGLPVARAAVTLYSADTSLGSAKTGSDGCFSLTPAREQPGGLELQVSAPGYAARRVAVQPLVYLDPLGKIVALSKQPTFTLHGRVVDRQGNPLAFVSITTSTTSAASPLDRVLLAEAESGADGDFSVGVATPGWYDLELRRSRGAATLARARVFTARDTEEVTLVVPQDSVRCSLVDVEGRAVPFSVYSLFAETGSSGTSGRGGGSSGTFGSALRFLWPEKATGIRVSLSGGGLEGSVDLRGQGDPCLIHGK